MKISFTFRHIEPSEIVKNRTFEKLEKIKRFEDRELTVNAIFSVEKVYKTVEFHTSGTHGIFVARESREDVMEAIDVAAHKLEQQLAKDKAKRKHHKGLQGSVPELIG